MRMKRVSANYRSHSFIVAVTLFLSVTGLLVFRGGVGQTRPVQEIEKINLSIEDPRPVAKAVEILEARCGCIITYEDTQYLHPSEIADVTLQVRKDLDKFPPGQAPKVLIPKPSALALQYDEVALKDPGGVAGVVNQLLEAHSARGNAGRFRLETDGQTIHVIPTASKNKDGAMIPQASVLDTVIFLPAEERTGMETLEAICRAVSQATNIHVGVGTIPLNLFLRDRYRQEVNSGKARDVLIDLLKTLQGPNQLSWRLLYDPGDKTFALNIHGVRRLP